MRKKKIECVTFINNLIPISGSAQRKPLPGGVHLLLSYYLAYRLRVSPWDFHPHLSDIKLIPIFIIVCVFFARLKNIFQIFHPGNFWVLKIILLGKTKRPCRPRSFNYNIHVKHSSIRTPLPTCVFEFLIRTKLFSGESMAPIKR